MDNKLKEMETDEECDIWKSGYENAKKEIKEEIERILGLIKELEKGLNAYAKSNDCRVNVDNKDGSYTSIVLRKRLEELKQEIENGK